MAATGFAVEHFYHGQLMMGGRLAGEARQLSASRGITPAMAASAVNDAPLPALPDNQVGSLALVRGKVSPFIFVQSVDRGGQYPFRHYLLVSPDSLRALSGNLRGVLALAQTQFPTYEMTGQTLPPVTLLPSTTPTSAQQEQAMLNLMTITRDRLNVIEIMLAAIIKGVPIYVRGAPPELPKRITLIEGLLSLLPPPARYGVTFATHTTSDVSLDAQVRLVADDQPLSPDVLEYVWGEPTTGGFKPEDDYARFIRSQLRLDPSLVSEATNALTPVAGWRLKRGDSMTDALAYSSYRLKMDESLINNLPVGANEASRVLAEDPTLSDELRVVYINHLLAFALVLDEDENTDLLTVVAKGQPELERTIIEAMRKALASGKHEMVYRRVTHWLTTPGGFKGMYWIDLLQRAALASAQSLVNAGDAVGLNQFLADVRAAPNAADFVPVLPQLIETSIPLASQDRNLAETVFALAATVLPAEQLQRVAAQPGLVAQLPQSVGVLLAQLSGQASGAMPDGLLARVVSDFGGHWRPLIAIRLSELVTLGGRYELLDSAALETLANAAQSPFGETYDSTLRWLARALSTDDLQQILDPPARFSLLQILLARGAYPELVQMMGQQQRLFFPGDKQLQFANMTHRLFIETPLSPDQLGEALGTMTERNVRPMTLAMAYFGALQQQHWSPEMASRATELTTLVFNNRLIAETIAPEYLAELLNYHVERRDQGQAQRVVGLMPAPAARKGEAGLQVMIAMYRQLSWNAEVQATALECLRRFVRRLSGAAGASAINRLGRELSDEVRVALDATRTMHQVLGGEQIGDYAYTLHTVAQFLYDTGFSYRDKNTLPSVNSLMSDIDSLSGNLNNEERAALAAGMLELMDNIAALASQHRAARSRENAEQLEALVSGGGSAATILDVFRVMGGYFARGKRLALKPDQLITIHPLGDRASHNLLREVEQINRLLASALRALPSDRKFSIEAAAIQGDIESLWGDLSLVERRTLVRDLAIDLQRIPDLILMITEKYDQKVLQDDSGLARKLDTNRQRPENTMEFYRFVHGYFAQRVR